MAYLQSFAQFDINSVNLYWYNFYAVDSGIQDDVNIVVNGQPYEDLFYVDADDGSYFLELVFLGSGIAQDSAGNIVAGTVNFIAEYDILQDAYLWYAEGLSLSAASIYNAAMTASNLDEVSLIQSALSGNDTIILSPFDDSIDGFAGNDTIDAGAGNDTVQGGSGNDNLTGGAGNDILDGGTGGDRARYDAASAGVTVNLASGSAMSTIGDLAGIGADQLISIEFASGGNFGDSITGSSTTNILHGYGGDDWISGEGSDDALLGGDGNDQILGGDGDDELYGDSGNDQLTGGAGQDQLYGDVGDDTFIDTVAGLGGDWVIGFGVGDKIVFTDATLAGFTFNLSGGTLTYTGGSLTLTGVTGTLVASAAAGGGVQLTLQANIPDPRNDFNGDGFSDMLLRHSGGTLTDWLGTANGSFADNWGAFSLPLSTSWQVEGTGDFNGDGRDDMLLRHSSGTLTDWLGTANGGFTDNWGAFAQALSTSWQVEGIGDFNGDGRDDMLLRHSSGTLTNWLGTANGGFTDNWGAFAQALSTEWQVEGTGDFNGDGRDDMLLRHSSGTLTDWLGTANGGFTDNWGAFAQALSTSWQVEGIGDFNGDGRDDMLLRHSSGTLTNWLGTANGGFVDNWGVFSQALATEWQVEGTGDFNGDGRDDMLLRHGSGTLTNWLGTANGSFTDNWGVFSLPLSTSWQVESIGDFNGDGRDDMLLRHSSGTLTNWLGTANGGFTDNWGVFSLPLSTSWQVQHDPGLLG